MEELKADGIAVNGLWPRTAIATAAVKNVLGGEELMNISRKPEIMADAAYEIFIKDSKEFTGNFCIDDLVLHEAGVKDFTNYADVSFDKLAPDFARCVDIHRKPGYDPVELFFDPSINFKNLKLAIKLIKKKLGFRYLMNVIPVDAALVKGSHGRIPEDRLDWPIYISDYEFPDSTDMEINSNSIFRGILDSVDID